MPSPQTVLQTLGSPLHTQPGSVAHVSLHPSPGAAPPSSHVSAPLIWPSPQMPMHVLGSPMHTKPSSTVHVSLHPSPAITPPSSHCSKAAVTTPSPHTVAQTLGSPMQS